MAADSAPACKPNISAAGVKVRQRFGRALIVLAVGAFVFGFLSRKPGLGAILVFVFAALAALNLLQARRRTCVSRAREGTFEKDDLTTTPAAFEDAHASRQVASRIKRDAALIGGALAAASAALIWLRH